MGQPKKREDMLLDCTKEIMEKRLTQQFAALKQQWSSQRSGLLACVENLCEQAFEKQKKVVYLQFALLRSSLLTESFGYAISLFDGEYYLDKEALHEIWDATFFFQYLDEDMAAVNAHLDQNLQRVQEYERKEMRYRVAYLYDICVNVCIAQLVPEFVLLPAVKEFAENENFKILLSGWLDESAVLYPYPFLPGNERQSGVEAKK